MRALKIITATTCVILTLVLSLCFIFAGDFTSLPCAIFAIAFAIAGWFLYSKCKFPLSWKDKALITVTAVFVSAFIIAVLIPDFVRAAYEKSSQPCVNNLRQLQAAKMEWALETGATNGTLVSESDITPYIQLDSHGKIPKCPAGGTYIIGRVGEDVKCSIGNSDWPNSHVLSGATDFDWWTDFKEAYARFLGLRHPQNPQAQ